MARAKHIFIMAYGFVLYWIVMRGFYDFAHFVFIKVLPYIGYYSHHPAEIKWHQIVPIDEWNEKRIDTIGQNGNTGAHYDI